MWASSLIWWARSSGQDLSPVSRNGTCEGQKAQHAFSFRPQGNYRSIASGARTEGGPVPFVRDNGQTTWKRLPGPESPLPKPGLQTCHINPDQLSCSRPKGLLGPTIPVSGAYPVCPPCHSHVSPPPPSCPHFSPWDWPVGPDTSASHGTHKKHDKSNFSRPIPVYREIFNQQSTWLRVSFGWTRTRAWPEL